MSCILLKVYGMVQGVSFRYYARQKAEELGLKGWARNCTDQTVEIMVCGEEEDLNSFTAWAKKGPTYAHVEKIENQSVDSRAATQLTDFIIE
ncbi:MAG: hypothetical protein A3F16_05635 [Deltaproteobacteria bacterium RIFCSPHIGHO2_12_FULL_43_9]|nr:MAG: hypothetical protein A3F16_05635 [Deltaproteobacteria bacterium RIFCSPHIGHO2_12_FULL_43_9]